MLDLVMTIPHGSWKPNMKRETDYLVVGGGFRSIIAAYCLARDGARVALVERGNMLCNILSPIMWGDHRIDRGPQFFDSMDASDVAFFEEMLGEGMLTNIGYSYASFLNGRLTDDFALPDWRTLGDDVTHRIFAELLRSGIAGHKPDEAEPQDDFAALLRSEGGPTLYPYLERLCQKFLCMPPQKLSPKAAEYVTFTGRKLLFDPDISADLKRSGIIDDVIAGPRKARQEDNFSLYPASGNMEDVRLAMEAALRKVGVELIFNSCNDALNVENQIFTMEDSELHYATLVATCDAREAEELLFGERSLFNATFELPKLFHCFLVPKQHIHDVHYAVNFDQHHKCSRVTNMGSYADPKDESDHGVLIAEQPVETDSEDWTDPIQAQTRVFEELKEMTFIDTVDARDMKTIRVPVSYRVPKTEFDGVAQSFEARVAESFGDRVLLPTPNFVTRKSALNDLRELGMYP